MDVLWAKLGIAVDPPTTNDGSAALCECISCCHNSGSCTLNELDSNLLHQVTVEERETCTSEETGLPNLIHTVPEPGPRRPPAQTPRWSISKARHPDDTAAMPATTSW